ncbi:MAG: patatin-like phospholipase family protein [Rhodoblastus sp.]
MMSFMRKAQTMWNDESGAAAQTLPIRKTTPAPMPAPQKTAPRRPRIALALGSGAARGWCHIGILREFQAAGLKPDIIAGTSIGALVGGCYAAGQLDAIEQFSRSLSRRRVLSLLDLSFSGGGLFSGARLRAKLEAALVGKTVEGLPIPFAAVATEISTGNEIWLRSGPLARALNASYALPGLLEPVNVDGRWLFDGALVNPIPVSVCRALGADFVIAINVVSDSMFRGAVIGDRTLSDDSRIADDAAAILARKAEHAPSRSWLGAVASPISLFRRRQNRSAHHGPGLASIMLDAFSITQDRIARSRLAGDPPDLLINARLDNFGLFDFHRAAEMIEVGRETARRRMPDILEHLSMNGGDLRASAQN